MRNCPICENADGRIVEEVNHLLINIQGGSIYNQKIKKCNVCNMLFVDNPFDEKQLKDWYSKESQYCDDFYDELPTLSEWNRFRCQLQHDFINKNINNDIESVMEIGAAFGYNLSLWNVKHKFAVEPSQRSCDALRDKYGIDSFCGTFQEYALKNDDSFDLIICSHVLEHIVDVKSFLKMVHKHVSKYLYVEVPTINLAQADGVNGVFVEEHVNYFSWETLKRLMEMCGFYLINSFQDKQNERAWGEPLMTIWSVKPCNSVKEVEKNTCSYEDYVVENNAKKEKIENKIKELIKSKQSVGLYGVNCNTAKKLLAYPAFKKINTCRVWSDNKLQIGLRWNECPISLFSIEESENCQKIVICNSFSKKWIKKDLDQLGLSDKVFDIFE